MLPFAIWPIPLQIWWGGTSYGQPNLIHLEATLIFFPSFYYSADLQKAIDSENYALAAGLRDEVAKLEV